MTTIKIKERFESLLSQKAFKTFFNFKERTEYSFLNHFIKTFERFF